MSGQNVSLHGFDDGHRHSQGRDRVLEDARNDGLELQELHKASRVHPDEAVALASQRFGPLLDDHL